MARICKIYVDVNSGYVYDANGNQLTRDTAPYITYKEKVQLQIQYLTAPPGTPPVDADLSKYTSLTGYTIASSAVIDNNRNHYDEGALNTGYSGAVTSIAVKNLEAAPRLKSGELLMINSAGEQETIAFTNYTVANSIYTFTVSDTLTYTYLANDVARVKETPIIKTENSGIVKTGQNTGLFLINLDAKTQTFQKLAEGKPEIDDCYFEQQIFETTDVESPIFTLQFSFRCLGILDDGGTIPPASASDFYSKVQVDALLLVARQYQFSIDGTTLWHDTQVVNVDLYYRERYPDGEWGNAIALLAGPAGADGSDGWSPVLAVVSDGERRVLQISDWAGGEGTKPATGGYIGVSGIVSNIADAVDIRGATGATGAAGTNAPQVVFQYSADSASWHSNYTAGDIYFRVSVDGGSTYGSAMQFSSSGVNTPLEFDNDDLTAGVLTVSGLRPVIAVIDNNGKVIYADEITYGATDTTVDLTSYGTLTGTWTIIFGQGKDGADAPQDNWRVIDTADFTATPASTSTLSMSDTSAIYVGDGIKYTDGRGTYYAIVTAVSANTSITIAGAAFDTGSDVTALYVGNNKVIQTSFFVSGTYADGTGDLLAADMNTYEKWQGRKAYLVMFSAVHKTADTGAAQPKINVKVNGSAVSTNDSNNGVQLSTAGNWVDNSAVAINTSNYDINRGEAIEISCTAAGTNSNASDLTVSCVFVQE